MAGNIGPYEIVSKVISLVKVLWRNHEREAATWEPEA